MFYLAPRLFPLTTKRRLRKPYVFLLRNDEQLIYRNNCLQGLPNWTRGRIEQILCKLYRRYYNHVEANFMNDN